MKKKKVQVGISDLDRNGFGQSAIWRKNELGNPKKVKLYIPQTIPGETVQVTIEDNERKWQKAMPDHVVKQHPDRTVPPCPHFDKCGGCVWQHWQYEGQLEQKITYVKEALKTHGFDPFLVEEIIGMKQPWHYRNKMEFTFSPQGELGLHQQGEFRTIIPLETCLIARPETVAVAMEVADWAKEHQLTGYDKDKKEGLLRNLMIRQSFKTEEIMLALFATRAPFNSRHCPAEELVKRIQTKFPQVKSILWLENTNWADRTQAEKIHLLGGRNFIHDEIAGYRFQLWFDTFFQTNPVQAEKLIETALELARPQPSDKVIDLFCGVGTFSLPFAERVRELVGIEIIESSVASAKRNAKENGLINTCFLAETAKKGMDQALNYFGDANLLLLDPPRSGAGGKVMRKIGRSRPERIIYISCNPDSFAADCKELVQFGYSLKRVQPLDLFPHTTHVECVAEIILHS